MVPRKGGEAAWPTVSVLERRLLSSWEVLSALRSASLRDGTMQAK